MTLPEVGYGDRGIINNIIVTDDEYQHKFLPVCLDLGAYYICWQRISQKDKKLTER